MPDHLAYLDELNGWEPDSAAKTVDRSPDAPSTTPAAIATLLSASGPLREPLLFVSGATSRTLLLQVYCHKGVAGYRAEG